MRELKTPIEVTPLEVSMMLDAATPRDKALVGLMALAGLKPRQVAGLRLSDVSLDDPAQLHIEPAYMRAERHTVPIEPLLADYLVQYLKIDDYVTILSEWLFPSAGGPTARQEGWGDQPLSLRAIYDVVRQLGRRLGLGDFNPSSLRRACIRRWLNEGMPLPEIQRRLGAGTPRFLYSLSEARRREARARRRGPRAVGRPRETERDRLLVQMVDREGLSYEVAAIRYNHEHQPQKDLTRSAVRRAVQRWRKRHGQLRTAVHT